MVLWFFCRYWINGIGSEYYLKYWFKIWFFFSVWVDRPRKLGSILVVYKMMLNGIWFKHLKEWFVNIWGQSEGGDKETLGI